MNNMTCTARNTWTDSGDRGAAKHDHDREYHPTHAHVWGPSSYSWEQAGQPHIAPGDQTKVTPRPVTAERCVECGIRPSEDRAGKCGPNVIM